jgi:hypothetical protein
LKVRSFFEGAGISILFLAGSLWPMLSLYHLGIYHDPASESVIALGVAIDLALTAVLFTVVLAVLDHFSPKRFCFAWAISLAFCVTKAIDFAIALLNFHGADLCWTLKMKLGLLCATLTAALLLSHFFPAIFRKSLRAGRGGLAALGCCVFWMFPQLVYTAERTRAHDVSEFSRKVEPPRWGQPRIMWVLLDELSYDQVYDHRQSDVKLPHFDELKTRSVVFSDVQPIGYYTERIVPSLFLGRRVDRIRSSLQRDLYVHDAAASRWEPFNQQATIFADAKREGWTTGVAGWYNPYCHILEGVLDSCYWQANEAFPRKIFGENSDLLNAAAYPFDLILSHFISSTANGEPAVDVHIEDYEDVTGAARSLIQDESIRLAFLHLPAPHPPGIYSRKINKLGATGDYLDNLVLADKTLGHVLDEIQKTASAQSTILFRRTTPGG